MPPSLPHEVVLELLRLDGELARTLLGDTIAPRAWTPENAPAAFVRYPTERRADNVTIFRDAEKRARLAVIIEVQRKIDPRKRYSWPAYLVEARDRYRCPTYLVVIAFHPKVAQWARASIALGHPGFVLTPVVITKEHVPLIRTAKAARRAPLLAVVSAIAHRSLRAATAAHHALRKFPRDMRGVYWSAILSELPPTQRSVLEKNMKVIKIDMPILPNGPLAGCLRASGRAEIVLALAKSKAGKVSRKTAAAIERVAENRRMLEALALRLARATTNAQAKQILDRVTRENPPIFQGRRPRERIQIVATN